MTQSTYSPEDELIGAILVWLAGLTGLVVAVGWGALDFLWSTPLTLPLGILLLHFVMDFICQSDWMALGKSSKWWPLFWHVLIYSSAFGYVWGPEMFLWTFVTHFVTDYFTSRWTTNLFKRGERHDFFVIIGLDQLIHATTLTLTYLALFGG